MDIKRLYSIFKDYPSVVTDSRKCVKDSIFFALKGEHFDGNCFARQAIESGCAYAIVDNPEFADESNHILLVDDVLRTLQNLANYHRRQFSIPVIGITGTSGKTTTKELISTVLKSHYNVLYTQGNLNNHIGVPLTLLRMQAEHDIAVIEMGASHCGEIAALCNIAEPTHGLITNVGKAHLEGFGTFDCIVNTKTELYRFLENRKGEIFLHNEDSILSNKTGNLIVHRYGTSENIDVRGTIIDCNPFLKISWAKSTGESFETQTQLIGSYNLCNVLAAVCVGLFFKVPEKKIRQAIAEYKPENSRSQLKITEHNRLIVDVYNANPSSMQAAIESLLSTNLKNKSVILGAMLELGVKSEEEHQNIIKILKEADLTCVLLCGEEFVKLPENPFRSFENTDQLISYLSENRLENKSILIKGSRKMCLERVIDLL